MYFLLILFYASSQTCQNITCGSLSYPNCEYKNSSGLYISSCLPNEICNYTSTETKKTCNLLPGTLFPGDLCSLDSQCVSGTCESGLCAGPSYQSPCTLKTGCQVGLYCDGQICQNQLKPGHQCENDFQCINSAFCNLGTCTLYWSLLIEDKVEPSINGLSIGCKTAAAIQFGEDWVCAKNDESAESDPSCTLGQKCFSKTGAFEQPCTCGHNEYGNSYCPLFPGDPQVQSAIIDSQVVFQNNSICNTYSRFSLNCFLAYPELLGGFLQFAINYTLAFEGYYAITYESDDCTLQSIDLEFYSLVNAYRHYKDYLPCNAYYCPEEFVDLHPDQCILAVNYSNYGVLTNIQYANDICDWNYTCTQEWPDSNGTCEPIIHHPGNPGDFCNLTYPCKSNKCVDNLCLGIRENEICLIPSDCQPGFYCDQTTLVCEKLKLRLETCNHNYECSNYLLCNLGTCINYFSLPNNENTDVFTDGYSLACSSGFAIDTNQVGNYMCTPAPVSNKKNNCMYKNQECYDNSQKYVHYCSCSLTEVFNAESTLLYCPPFVGDIYFQNVIANLKNLLNWNSVCNTVSRLSERCYLRSEDYIGYYYFYITNLTMFVNYSSLYGVQDCIRRTLMYKDYRNEELLKEWIKKQKKNSNNNDESFVEWIQPLAAFLVFLT